MKALVICVLLIGCFLLLSAIVDTGTRSINNYQNNVDKVLSNI